MINYKVDKKVLEELRQFIEDNMLLEKEPCFSAIEDEQKNYSLSIENKLISIPDFSLSDEATFRDTVFKYIDERGLKDTDVYKRSGISKQTFSRIRCDKDYQPKKDTAIQICIGLRLNIDEANDLLMRAGFSLSRSIKRDLVLHYFIKTKKHDIDYINRYLYAEDLPLIKIG